MEPLDDDGDEDESRSAAEDQLGGAHPLWWISLAPAVPSIDHPFDNGLAVLGPGTESLRWASKLPAVRFRIAGSGWTPNCAQPAHRVNAHP